MRHFSNFIAGAASAASGETAKVINPANQNEVAALTFSSAADVDAAVLAARTAFPLWARTGLQVRANLMLALRDALKGAYDEIVGLIIEELGKTIDDAKAEADRALDVLVQASSVGNWYGAIATPGVSQGVDTQEIRFPIGVVAGISPFNFPILIPVVQSAMSIACGNTFIMKPSERVPSACMRLAEMFKQAGFPDGVFNVVNGGRLVVDRLIEHPDVAGITFVGSTAVARHVRKVGVASGKRVQAFGGGKNHLVVMPDADLDMTADAAISAGYGAAGQRCMAVSVIVAVGDVGDALVDKIAERIATLKLGDPSDPKSQIGPVISGESRDRISDLLDKSAAQGVRIVVDGRHAAGADQGWFIGPTLIDQVTPASDAHAVEIFGPVLSVVRVPNYVKAMEIIASHPMGNGAAIFTQNGSVAHRFVQEVEAGQVGVNIPIPFPVFFHSFGGWKDSAFTETKLFGPGALPFCTRSKTVSTRWPEPSSSKIDLGFPSNS